MATLSSLTSAINLGGSCPIIMEWETNHSLLPGDICYLNANGQLETFSVSGSNFTSNTIKSYVGRSLGYASPGDSALVIVSNENTLFEIPVWAANPDNAVLKRDQLSKDYVGRVVTDAGGQRVHVVNLDTSTDPVFRPLVFVRHSGHAIPGYTVPWNANGEQYGRVGALIVPIARRLS